MLIPIDKINVEDRIRKDYGNIAELAEDIRVNGLINDIVINRDYKLLAGERRLRACMYLGWDKVEVKMMDTRDAEHELNVEISENESRKEFSKAERVDYMRRLLRIEQAKASERMKAGGQNPVKNSAQGKTRDIVSNQFGVSHDTMKKEFSIVDNKDLLTPEDFADWDEGRLSTNKAFLKMKAEKDKLKNQVDTLQKDIKTYASNIADLNATITEKDSTIARLENDTRTFTAAAYLERENKNVYRLLDGCDDIYELSREVERLLEDKLAPLKFRRCFEAVSVSESAKNNISALINSVSEWCREILSIINEDDDVIDVY